MHKSISLTLLSGHLAVAYAQVQPTPLPPVVVTGSVGYAPASAESTSKTAIPLKDLPASIQVVPGELLRDRGVTRTDQLLENVSGVLSESSYGGNGATFFNIRGFSENNGLRDGFRNFGYYAFRDVQNIERVEVFKGPTGALYGGVGAVGGYINTVSKRPGSRNFGEVAMTDGTHGLARTTLDVNRVLGDGLTARLNGAVESNSTFRDNAGYRSWSLAPSISWKDKDGTSLTLLTEFNHLKRDGFDFGVPNVPNYRDLSRTRYYGLRNGVYPGLAGDFGKNDTDAATLIYERKLDETWKLRVASQYVYAHQLSTQSFPSSQTPDGSQLGYAVYTGAGEASTQYGGQVELAGKLSAGGLSHDLLLGIDYGYLQQGSKGSTVSTVTLDLADPAFISPLTPSDPLAARQGRGKDYGIYIQDVVDLAPKIKVLVGARGDRFENSARESGAETSRSIQTVFSPRVGVVWQPTDRTSVFADWSRSHSPNVGHSGSNATYNAEIADQVEVGVKHELLEDSLNATFTVFDINRSNILTSDPANPLLQVLSGKQGSRGAEFDLAGTISPGWKVITSYTYLDSVVKSDTNLPVGNRLSNVPRHHASAWSVYEFRSLPGFGAGAGLYYVGAREANLPNTYKLPGYVRADAALTYKSGAWRTQLNVINVFNRRYYTGGSAGVFNYTLDPSRLLTAQLTVAYQF